MIATADRRDALDLDAAAAAAFAALQAAPTRIALDPAPMEQDLSRLVLTLVEFVRRLLEAQAVRRTEAGRLADAQVEQLGLGLNRAREAVLSICTRLEIAPETLNLDLGPLGRLL